MICVDKHTILSSINWKDRFKWHRIAQLPHWVKKEFGWYCLSGSDKPCPKHGLYDFQHPKHVEGKLYEYKTITVAKSRNNYEAIFRRMRYVNLFHQIMINIQLFRKIRWFILRKFIIKKWVDTHGNVPDWVKEKIKDIQNDGKNSTYLFENKYWIIEGRYSIYRILFVNRKEVSNIYKKRKIKGVLAYLQYTDPEKLKKIDTKGKELNINDLLRSANFIKK